MKKRYIIGIVGAFGSGKTTAAAYLARKGYKRIYLSSFLEKEAQKRKLPLTRKILQDIGNEMREENGVGVLMKKALLALRGEQKIVIDGLRNFGEIEELRKNPEAIVLGIVANRKVRFERIKKLKRREKLTPKLFLSLDLRDLGVGEKITGLQTAICIAVADVFIDSNGGFEDFYEKLDRFLEDYEK